MPEDKNENKAFDMTALIVGVVFVAIAIIMAFVFDGM